MPIGAKVASKGGWYHPQSAGFSLPQPEAVVYCGKYGNNLARTVRDRSWVQGNVTPFGSPTISTYKAGFQAGSKGLRLGVNDAASGSFMVVCRSTGDGTGLSTSAHIFGSGSGGGITFALAVYYDAGAGTVLGSVASASGLDNSVWRCWAGRWNGIVSGDDMTLRNMTGAARSTANLPGGSVRVLGPHTGFSIGTAQNGTAYGGACEISFLALWNGVNLSDAEEDEVYAGLKAEHDDIYGVTI
jgi:hypothetical protein